MKVGCTLVFWRCSEKDVSVLFHCHKIRTRRSEHKRGTIAP